jgi:hypothetical protein
MLIKCMTEIPYLNEMCKQEQNIDSMCKYDSDEELISH